MALPCIALGAYNVLAFFPVLVAIRWAKTAENATDYSLNNTVRNMLFLPCTRDQKYGGKQVIDSFFHRIGDVLSAALVFVGTTYFAWGGSGFAVFNIFVVCGWLVLAFRIGREYKQLAAAGVPPGPQLLSVRTRALPSP
jgi:AAA family ATP:ADP antiporter